MDSSQWDERYRAKALVWSAGPNQFLVQQVADLPVGRALDVACGEGRNSLWLAERGWDVVATDFSPVAIDKARIRAAELGLDIDFRVADATQPVDGEFDLVLLFYLQVPHDGMARALDACRKALAPGGLLLVVGHDARNLHEGYGGPQSAAVLYSPGDVTGWVDGLTIERAETVDRVVEKDGERHVALDVLVRARRPR